MIFSAWSLSQPRNNGVAGASFPMRHGREAAKIKERSTADVMDRLFDKEDNEARPHQGRWCFGKTPMQTFLDAMPMTKEKMIAA